MAKEDTGYPECPARNVCDGAQDPVTARAKNSRGIRIQEPRNSTDKLGSAQNAQTWLTNSMKVHTALK